MAKEKEDIWLRLARLNECCEVVLHSFHVEGKGRTLRWRMTVKPRDGSAPPIVVVRPKAADTVLLAIDRAGAAGWCPK